MKRAAAVVSNIIDELRKNILVGVCGRDLDTIAKKIMDESNAYSSSFGYNDFPSYICVSLSNSNKSELTHGIPTDEPFQKGDLVSIDVCCYVKDEHGKKYHSDAAVTVVVEPSDEIKNNLLLVTKNCLKYVVEQIRPNFTTTRDIGQMIQNYVESRGYYVIREFGGHGIGNELHENFFVPNYKTKEKGQLLVPGMFLCIEPLVQIGNDEIVRSKVTINDKYWEVIVAKDKNNLNAHFEHTVYVDDKKATILTVYGEEN